MNEQEITRCISKKLITQNNHTDSTFMGAEVTSCSIEPQGVVKATVNQLNGVVGFDRYDPTWQGEVDLHLETTDGEGSSYNYINNYKVEFRGIGFEEPYEIETIDSEDEEIEEMPADWPEVEGLSDEEEETTGGKTTILDASHKTVRLKKGEIFRVLMSEQKASAFSDDIWKITRIIMDGRGIKYSKIYSAAKGNYGVKITNVSLKPGQRVNITIQWQGTLNRFRTTAKVTVIGK